MIEASTHHLLAELTHHEFLRQQLEIAFPDADEETILGTLSGETDLNELIAAVLRSRADDLALAKALIGRMSDMKERLDRLEHRAEKKREVCTKVMDRAGIRKITEADMTISLTRMADKVQLLVPPDALPPEYQRVKTTVDADKVKIGEALRSGQSLNFALLSNGGVTLTVRTK